MKGMKGILLICICVFCMTSCGRDDTYKLAKKIYDYDMKQSGYEDALAMAQKGNYDANCKDCFKGVDTSNISLFAYACKVDEEIAKAIYENGANIESANDEFYQTPLLAAVYGNRNHPEMIYWLIDQGADVNAVDYNQCSVFHYLIYWDDNEETQELIQYFKDNCDMELLKKQTKDARYCDWDALWDEDGNLIFY